MEFGNLDLGDERLNKRAVKMIDTFSKAPKSSIPQACQGWAETQATYRFYANENVTWDKLLTAHTGQVEHRSCHAVPMFFKFKWKLKRNSKYR